METETTKANSLKESAINHLIASKEWSKKAWLINAAILLALIIAWAAIHNIQVHQYRKDMAVTVDLIRQGAIDSEYMIDDYSTEWSDAIDYGTDFDDAIDHQHEQFIAYGEIDAVEKTQKRVKLQMQELRNPPGKYEEEYQYLMELYGSYKTYSNLSIYPSGSLLTFNEKTGELKDEIDEGVDKLETLIER